MNKIIITAVAASVVLGSLAQERGIMQANPEAKLHRFSTTVEKERPELNQETKDLIAAYRRDPSDENRAALRKQVAKNYDAVVARKKAKLEELKRTECRIEARTESRKSSAGYPNVTFRVVREDK